MGAGLNLAVLTNSPAAAAERSLELAGLHARFDAVIARSAG